MSDELISVLIAQIESHGLLFESESPNAIGFWSAEDNDGSRKFMTFSNWSEVEAFANQFSKD